MQVGDTVAVYGDVNGQCRRGYTQMFTGQKIFLGNGKALMSRAQLFVESEKPRLVVWYIRKTKEHDCSVEWMIKKLVHMLSRSTNILPEWNTWINTFSKMILKNCFTYGTAAKRMVVKIVIPFLLMENACICVAHVLVVRQYASWGFWPMRGSNNELWEGTTCCIWCFELNKANLLYKSKFSSLHK